MVRITIGVILVLSGFYVGTIAAEERAATLQDQIKFLLDEEKSLREALQAKVQRIQTETANLNASIAPCQCSTSVQQKTGPEVAFTGTIPSTMSSLTASTVFNFSSDLVNVGQAFDINTAHFVVPTNGLYGFSLTLYMNPGRFWTALRLVKNGNPILGVKTNHYYYSSTNRQQNMATNYVIGNFSAGEEIWPQYVTGSSPKLYASGVTTFSGVLLHAF